MTVEIQDKMTCFASQLEQRSINLMQRSSIFTKLNVTGTHDIHNIQIYIENT